MKSLHVVPCRLLPAFLLVGTSCLSAKAQKLPNVQTVNVLAPLDVKTDGNPKEWANQFEAYNKATSLFYTMANDNENLYLTVQITDANTISRILESGITLTIKPAENDTKPLAITYPLVNSANGQLLIEAKLKHTLTIADSDLNTINKQLVADCRAIVVTGVKQIPGNVIPVNNTFDIKAAGLFNHQKAYTCEMAISLKYLVPLITEEGTFNYSIGINESFADPRSLNTTTPISFSGRYTLASK